MGARFAIGLGNAKFSVNAKKYGVTVENAKARVVLRDALACSFDDEWL